MNGGTIEKEWSPNALVARFGTEPTSEDLT